MRRTAILDNDLQVEMEGGTARRVIKQLLGVWAIGYPIISILPLLSTGGDGAGGVAVGGLASLIVAGALFGPWIVGLIILGVLVLVAPGPTPIIRRGRPEPEPESEYAGPGYWKPNPARASLLTRLAHLGYNPLPDDEDER